MIFRDSHGLLVDANGDAGDSARAAGIVDLFGNGDKQSWKYVGEMSGLCVRHPFQSPWDNPLNFSRDQEICLMAGLWRSGSRYDMKLARQVFWKQFCRFFFCQNIERDKNGSRKYLWPHEFYKDSNPTSITKKLSFNWRKFKWDGFIAQNVTDENGNKTYQRKAMDFCDPMFLHHIGHLILCARIYWLYWVAFLGFPFLAMSIIFCSKDISTEQNQIQCMVKVAGKWAVWLYKKCNPVWEIQTMMYWESRNQKEIGTIIIKNLTEET